MEAQPEAKTSARAAAADEMCMMVSPWHELDDTGNTPCRKTETSGKIANGVCRNAATAGLGQPSPDPDDRPGRLPVGRGPRPGTRPFDDPPAARSAGERAWRAPVRPLPDRLCPRLP